MVSPAALLVGQTLLVPSLHGLFLPDNIRNDLDFLLLAMNQLANMASSCRYGFGGRRGAPLVIRAIVGRGWGQGFQHSKSMHAVMAHIPGLKVVLPTTPRDAKGLLIAAIRDDDPVLFFEHRWLYWQEAEVPEGSFVEPLGKGRILRKGSDLTIVATSWMNVEAVHAASILERRGVSIEIVDPRCLVPLDQAIIVESVKKTGRCLVADNDWVYCGFSAEVAARIPMDPEECYRYLRGIEYDLSPLKQQGLALFYDYLIKRGEGAAAALPLQFWDKSRTVEAP